MIKLIMTGATSFIGVNLIREWLCSEVEIYAVVRPDSKNLYRLPGAYNINVIELDMNEYNTLPEQISHADYFYHLAWDGARMPHRNDPEIQRRNHEAALKAFHAAEKMGCKFFLSTGSQAEYGLTSGLVDENYKCSPHTEYGKWKLHTCTELLNLARESGMKIIWTRLFSLYGPYDFPGTLIMTCIDSMLKNEPVKMTAGTQLWDYLYITDAVRAMKLFAEKDSPGGVYNVASGTYKPLCEFIQEIKTVMNSDSELLFGAVPYGVEGARNLTPCVEKIKTSLAWNPEINFSDGIITTVKYFNEAGNFIS